MEKDNMYLCLADIVESLERKVIAEIKSPTDSVGRMFIDFQFDLIKVIQTQFDEVILQERKRIMGDFLRIEEKTEKINKELNNINESMSAAVEFFKMRDLIEEVHLWVVGGTLMERLDSIESKIKKLKTQINK